MWLLAAIARERVGDSPSNNKKEAKKLQNKVAIVEAAKKNIGKPLLLE